MANWTISIVQVPINLLGLTVYHNSIVIRGDGGFYKEINGGPYNTATGQIVLAGDPGWLSAYTSGQMQSGVQVSSAPRLAQGLPATEIFSGTQDQVMNRFNAMQACANLITDQADPYTVTGGLSRDLDGNDVNSYNSNSTAATVLECGGFTPGSILLPNSATPGSEFRNLESLTIKSVIDAVNQGSAPADQIPYPQSRTENRTDNPDESYDIATYDPLGLSVVLDKHYDAEGNLTRSTEYLTDGISITNSFENDNRTTEWRDSGDDLFRTSILAPDGETIFTNFDPSNTQIWVEQGGVLDADGNQRISETAYDNGSHYLLGYDENGNSTWTQDFQANGEGTFTDSNGTVVTMNDGIAVPGYDDNYNPMIDYAPGGGTELGDPRLSITSGSDGDTNFQLNEGTEFRIPGGSEASISSEGLNIAAEGGSPFDSWGFASPTADSDTPSASFSDNHPGPLQQSDPLVLDLNGDGVTLISVQNSNAYFDYGGTGFAPKTGWVAATDGIVVNDTNSDGIIAGAELLGAVSGNAFNDLEALDGNSDGKIDSNDTAYANLKVWLDADGDGDSDAGELVSLTTAGIAAINLNTQQSGQRIEGNLVVETATFVRTDTTTGIAAEVNFATDTLNTRYTPPSNFEYSQTAFLLPTLVGYGNVPDLIYSMSMDSDLEDAVRDLVTDANSMTSNAFVEAFESLVFQWTGVSAIDPTSRGPLINAQHMAVVEVFYGATFAQLNGARPLSAATAANIEATYQAIVDSLTIRFAAVIPLSQLLNGVSWSAVEDSPFLPFASIVFDPSTDGIDVDFDELIEQIVQAAPASDAEKVGYYDLASRLVESLNVDLFDESKAALVAAFTSAATEASLDAIFQQQIISEILADNIIDARDEGSNIAGTSKADVVLSDAEEHYVEGGAGGDTYVYARGNGDLTIHDQSADLSGDKVLLVDIDPADVTLTRSANGNDLTLTDASTGKTITIEGQFLKFAFGTILTEIEELHFADGTIWTPDEIRTRILTASQTSGDNTVRGFHTADILDGGAGNDLLTGEGGGDTFVFGTGYGQDVVDAYIVYVTRDQADTILFSADLAPEDLTLTRNGSDLIISVTGTTDQLTIKDQFTYYNYSRVENFQFANTSWTWEDVELLFLQGTSGNDTLIGYGADDVLDGGAGNDILKGRQGSDTYIFGRGYGNDTIDDDNFSVIGDAPDRIIFGADIEVGDLELVRAGDDLVIRIAGTSDSLTVKNHFNPFFEIANFEFDDETVLTAADVQVIISNNAPGTPTHLGTSGDETITGSSAADIIDGLGGNDILRGANDSDTYLYGAGSGNDRIEEAGGWLGEDTLRLVALNPADVEFMRSGNDLAVRILSSSETMTVKDHFLGTQEGVEHIKFTDGTIWDRAGIQAEAWYRGTSGVDTLTGSGDAETFDGRGGNDILRGANGSDIYVYGAGSGNDQIEEVSGWSGEDMLKLVGLNASDVELARSGNDLIVRILSSSESMTVKDHFVGTQEGIEKIKFANGTIWDRTAIEAEAWFRGTSGAETIIGTGGADTFDGRGGDDILRGANDADTYLYGVGSANDQIEEVGGWLGDDTLKLLSLNASDVELSRIGNDLKVKILSSSETITVKDHFLGTQEGIEKIKFADNTIWDRTAIQANAVILGTSGAETINGSSAAETFDGLGGADTLSGAGGSDTYLHRDGSGDDTIYDAGSSGDVDVLKLIGVISTDVTLGRYGNDLRVTRADTGEVITVQYQFLTADYGINKIVFEDGSYWDSTYIAANAVTFGTSSADFISGSSAGDIIDGLGGNDYLSGGDGGDTYIYRVGSGNDTIGEYSDGSAIDRVKLIGLVPADVTLTRTGSDLYITITSSGEELKIADHFGSTLKGIEQIVFQDSTIWDRTSILMHFAPISGTSSNDNLYGTSADDTFQGGLGDDNIWSASGSDIHIYASGDGNDKIDEESGSNTEVDTLWFTDINSSGISLTKSGNDLMVNILATGHQIELDEQFYSPTANWGVEQIRFGNGTIWNRDTMMQNAWWNGTSGNDTLNGWTSFDNIDGGLGNDTINGDAGTDTLIGGGGDDTLTGGAGNDTIIFHAGFGNDTITDFTAGSGSDDVIEFHDGIFADFAAVQAASTQVGSDVKITVDGSNSIMLQNVTLASLHQDDFRHL